jgi:amidase
MPPHALAPATRPGFYDPMKPFLVALAATVAMTQMAHAQAFDPYASGEDLRAALAKAETTSEALVERYEARIEALDRAGPQLNAVLVLNPHRRADARALDRERAAGKVRGPLHGLPVLLKDNIESADDTATTAGSLALKDHVTGRDAPLVRRLTDAGGLILGKTNLSEWANFRSNQSISGWSAIGGLTRNPYVLDRTACGSSTGSAVAVAAGLAWAAVGTETDGSITCPASMNGIVGLKPTVGLVSRTYVIPIAESQDTPGPMTRTVADAAALLAAMAGSDPLDPATAEADRRKGDYLAGLKPDALRGVRLGVFQPNKGRSAATDALFAKTLETLKAAGAVLVEVGPVEDEVISVAEELVLHVEFKAGLEAYLAASPGKAAARTLAGLIAFNAGEPRELALFDQDLFEAADRSAGLEDPAYLKAKADGRGRSRQALDGMLARDRLAAIVAPTNGPASRLDRVNGGAWKGSVSSLPAVAGYPHLTVPMGQVEGLPVGLSFIGPAWSEARLLALGYAFEQATQMRRPPEFIPTLEAGEAVERAFSPLR